MLEYLEKGIGAMPDTGKNLKPQYEGKKESIISSQKTKVNQKSEYSNLSKIIDKSKKILEAYGYEM